MILDDIARADDEKIVDAIYRLNLAMVADTRLTDESWAKIKDKSLDLFNDFVGLVRPWDAKSREDRQKEAHDDLRSEYVRVIGNPDDPEFKRVIEAEIARMQANDDIAPAESDAARIDRLLRQRTAATPKG